MQSQLAATGITVDLAPAPVATELDAYRNGKEQIGLWYWGPDYPDPSDYLAFTPGDVVGLRAGLARRAPTRRSTALADAAAAGGSDSERQTQFQDLQQGTQRLGPVHPAAAAGQQHRLEVLRHRRGLQRRLDDRHRHPRQQVADVVDVPSPLPALRAPAGSHLAAAPGGGHAGDVRADQPRPRRPGRAALGQRAAEDPAIVAPFRHQYGLDQTLIAQYFTYLGNLLHGDLGTSTTTHNAVASDLAQALPATLELAIGAIVLSVIIGVVLGTVAAVPPRQGDRPGAARGVADGPERPDVLARPGPVLRLLLPAAHRAGLRAALAPTSGRRPR